LQNSPERDWICIQIPSPVIRRRGLWPFASPFLSVPPPSFVELRHKEHSTIVLYEVFLPPPLSLSLMLGSSFSLSFPFLFYPPPSFPVASATSLSFSLCISELPISVLAAPTVPERGSLLFTGFCATMLTKQFHGCP